MVGTAHARLCPPYKMTQHALSFSRHERPEICIDIIPLENRGRREDRMLAAPAARLQQKTQAAVTTGSTGATRPSLRNGVTAYGALSPEYRA